ncbi:MAG: AAA family ATPase, partial [Deltaproteobacteria bacterium]
ATQVCDALTYAHGEGVIHRDLKPENIFLCEGPVLLARILDFGIARVAQERVATQTGNILGTLLYMSPEQARGESALDHRTDLWSLGVVLYRALAGRHPFESETGPGTLFQILLEPAPPLGLLRPDLPRPLAHAVMRALSKSRDERYATAAAMRAEFDSLDRSTLAGLASPAAPSGQHAFAATVDSKVLDASAPTRAVAAVAGTVENRLISVVCLRGVRDVAWIESLASQFDARAQPLTGDAMIVLFGYERWHGDEPYRAVNLGLAALAHARGVGVATGRVTRDSARVTGDAVDAAALLAGDAGVIIDATTASVVGFEFRLENLPDGTARAEALRAPARAEDRGAFETLFVGREAERKLLTGALERARDDRQFTSIVITAGAGLGKTRLLEVCLAEVAVESPDLTVLRASCDRRRRDTPFSALRDALGTAIDARVVNVLSSTSPGIDAVAGLDRARSAVETLLRDLAERGSVLLVLDDTQWLDPSSRATLRWLHENAGDLPLAVWLFSRPEGRESTLDSAPGASVIDLPPLAARDAQKVLKSLLGDAPAALLERAGGHPLFLEELAKMYARHGIRSMSREVALPVSIQGALLAQLDQMEPTDREFVKRASILGQPWWLEAVVTLGGEPGAAPRLRKSGLVAPQARSRFESMHEFTFRTRLVPEVAYELWTDEQRARLHGQAAAWLAERREAAADEIGRHWEAAGDRERAADAFVLAAERAASVADTETTVAHATRVLALSGDSRKRWRALVASDDVSVLAGDPAARRAGIAELVALATSLGDAERAESAWRRCGVDRLANDIDAARAAGADAIEFAEASGALRWASAAHHELALLESEHGDRDAGRAHATRAVEIAERIGDPWLLARGAAAQGYVASAASELERSLERYTEAANVFARIGDRRREAQARSNMGDVMLQLGRVVEAATEIEAAIAAAQRCGNARTVRAATHNLGVCKRLLGDIEAAQRLQGQALDGRRERPTTHVLAAIAEEMAYVAIERGDVDLSPCVNLAAKAREASELGGFPDLVASQRALALRLDARVSRRDVEEIAAVRALGESAPDAASRAVCRVAVFEAAGKRDEDRAWARAGLEQLGAQVIDADSRAAVIRAFARRVLAPDELLAVS